jgi:hypothetical protein
LVAERREGTRHLSIVRPDGFGIVQQYLARFCALKMPFALFVQLELALGPCLRATR